MAKPLISVIIPTYNRAALLRSSLESLACQSLALDDYEVVVVDDGSSDATRDLCAEFPPRLRLKYFRIDNSGISAAKNLGIFAATAPLLFFFDDDDIAHPNLLAEHLRAHRRYPEESTAVLGYTEWAPTLPVTPVMHYIMDVGQFLFAYRNLSDGQELDFTYFWGGRSSCKRSLLVRHGVFCQEFRFGCEDIELGYRLAKHGLKVRFHRRAIQYMNRPITFDEFCRRCEKQGRSQVHFGRLHGSDPKIRQYCRLDGAEEKWKEVQHILPRKAERVREREPSTGRPPEARAPQDGAREERHGLYNCVFNAFVLKGIIEAIRDQNNNESAKERPQSTLLPNGTLAYQGRNDHGSKR